MLVSHGWAGHFVCHINIECAVSPANIVAAGLGAEIAPSFQQAEVTQLLALDLGVTVELLDKGRL